jgi:SOS response regulatory protein OraA/RecX
MGRVTGLRTRRGGGVLVQVDGDDWRVLPADVVVRAQLTVGTELDRSRLRAVAHERRRARALAAAGSALRVRDLPVRRLEQRLERSGIARTARVEAVAALQAAGIVDDERYACRRALALAGRGAGDAAIRSDLRHQGLSRELVDRALDQLEPESERAERIIAVRGRSPATARFLARKGFAEDTVEFAAGEVLG